MGEIFPTPSTLAELEGTSPENITLSAHHVATKNACALNGSYYRAVATIFIASM